MDPVTLTRDERFDPNDKLMRNSDGQLIQMDRLDSMCGREVQVTLDKTKAVPP
jgi:hypothetical protein